jgi:hypothetical protein
MENIFAIMSAKLDDPAPPVDVDALRRKIRKVWKELPQETFRRCAESMPARLRQVIKLGGKPLPN